MDHQQHLNQPHNVQQFPSAFDQMMIARAHAQAQVQAQAQAHPQVQRGQGHNLRSQEIQAPVIHVHGHQDPQQIQRPPHPQIWNPHFTMPNSGGPIHPMMTNTKTSMQGTRNFQGQQQVPPQNVHQVQSHLPNLQLNGHPGHPRMEAFAPPMFQGHPFPGMPIPGQLLQGQHDYTVMHQNQNQNFMNPRMMPPVWNQFNRFNFPGPIPGHPGCSPTRAPPGYFEPRHQGFPVQGHPVPVLQNLPVTEVRRKRGRPRNSDPPVLQNPRIQDPAAPRLQPVFQNLGIRNFAPVPAPQGPQLPIQIRGEMSNQNCPPLIPGFPAGYSQPIMNHPNLQNPRIQDPTAHRPLQPESPPPIPVFQYPEPVRNILSIQNIPQEPGWLEKAAQLIDNLGGPRRPLQPPQVNGQVLRDQGSMTRPCLPPTQAIPPACGPQNQTPAPHDPMTRPSDQIHGIQALKDLQSPTQSNHNQNRPPSVMILEATNPLSGILADKPAPPNPRLEIQISPIHGVQYQNSSPSNLGPSNQTPTPPDPAPRSIASTQRLQHWNPAPPNPEQPRPSEIHVRPVQGVPPFNPTSPTLAQLDSSFTELFLKTQNELSKEFPDLDMVSKLYLILYSQKCRLIQNHPLFPMFKMRSMESLPKNPFDSLKENKQYPEFFEVLRQTIRTYQIQHVRNINKHLLVTDSLTTRSLHHHLLFPLLMHAYEGGIPGEREKVLVLIINVMRQNLTSHPKHDEFFGLFARAVSEMHRENPDLEDREKFTKLIWGPEERRMAFRNHEVFPIYEQVLMETNRACGRKLRSCPEMPILAVPEEEVRPVESNGEVLEEAVPPDFPPGNTLRTPEPLQPKSTSSGPSEVAIAEPMTEMLDVPPGRTARTPEPLLEKSTSSGPSEVLVPEPRTENLDFQPEKTLRTTEPLQEKSTSSGPSELLVSEPTSPSEHIEDPLRNPEDATPSATALSIVTGKIELIEELEMSEEKVDLFDYAPQTPAALNLKPEFKVPELSKFQKKTPLEEYREFQDSTIGNLEDLDVQKTILDVVKEREVIWKTRDCGESKMREWEKVGMEVWKRTEKIVSVPQLRLFWKQATINFAYFLRECICVHRLDREETELQFELVEIYPHFKFYREQLFDYEKQLRNEINGKLVNTRILQDIETNRVFLKDYDLPDVEEEDLSKIGVFQYLIFDDEDEVEDIGIPQKRKRLEYKDEIQIGKAMNSTVKLECLW